MVKFRKIVFIALASVCMLGGAVSCSVKELRDECPVWVTVLFDQFIKIGQTDGIVSFSGAELIDRPELNFLSYIGKGYVQEMPRDYARVAVLSGVENERFSESSMYVPYGKQAGLVWAYAHTFAKNQDEYLVDAEPHKQYCKVKFMFDESPTAPTDYMWRFRIKAECNGMNVYTLEPLEGDYCCPVGPNAVGEWYGIIPRQKSNNMMLEIYVPDGEGSDGGRLDYVIDLGKRFEEKGYDWSEEDLKDIQVKVGFVAATIVIDVEPWVDDTTYRDVDI